MANEDKKDFNAMLLDSKDMPKLQIVTDPGTIERYGGNRMYFAPPIDYDRAMRMVPKGRLTTITDIRAHFARANGADFTEPITAGIFVSIAAWASFQRGEDPLLAHAEGRGRAEPKVPRGNRGPEGEA